MDGRLRRESIRTTDSVHFCEEVDCIQYSPSIVSQASDEVTLDDVGDYDFYSVDITNYQACDDTDSNYHRGFSHLINRTWRERLGEHCVRCSCTAVVGLALFLGVLIALVGVIKIVIAIVYWSSCPSANLSLYLLVSGISPFLFYVTCRTRRKHQGKAPETQRIVGRWRFSAFPCTLDTERSWQAGLAGVLSFFLLVWLVYGTALVVGTSQRLRQTPADCHVHITFRLTRNNATSSHITSSSPSLLSSLLTNSSLSYSQGARNVQRNDSTVNTEHSSTSLSPSSSSPSSSSSLSSSSSSSGAAAQTSMRQPSYVPPTSLILNNPLSNAKEEGKEENTSQNSNLTSSNHDAANSTDDMHGPSAVSSDVNVTSLEEESCVDCEGELVTWCLGLLLFDWLYMAALVINVLVLGTVPCCCYVGVDA